MNQQVSWDVGSVSSAPVWSTPVALLPILQAIRKANESGYLNGIKAAPAP
jgi:hypothetical protein